MTARTKKKGKEDNPAVWMWVCIIGISISIFLQWDTGIVPIDGIHDSLKYLEMATSLSSGNWLGDYNQMTLIRSPIYPGFLSINCKMGLALQHAQTIAYLLSVILLAISLRTIHIDYRRVAVVCFMCAFHPGAWIPSRFVATEALYTPAVTLALAGAIGVLGTVRKAKYTLFFWLVVLSISLAMAWRMRDESLWLIPASVVYAGFVLWDLMSIPGKQGAEVVFPGDSERKRRFTEDSIWKRSGLAIACILLPCLSVYCLTMWIQQRNFRHYGVAVVNELGEPGFVSAFSRLTRLDGESHHPYIPITRKAMSDAGRISPHFQLLTPYLAQQVDGNGWSRFGCNMMGICDELAGGWSVWAIRDAASSIGVYAGAVRAAAFYADLAGEIEAGCRAGQIVCTANPTGNMLAPPLKWIDISRVLSSAAKVFWMTLWIADLPEAYQSIAGSEPPPELAERYRPVVGTIAGHRSMMIVLNTVVLSWIFRIIQVIGGIWLMVWGVKTIVAWIQGRYCIDWKGFHRKQQVTILLLVLVVSRLAIVGYIDAMSYWAQSRYMMVIYPALITLFCLTLPSRPSPMPQYWTEAPAISSD
jgi:hypothetical protein